MDSQVWDRDSKFKAFSDYFTGKEDHNFQELFICNFNGWLNEPDYSRYIENASVEEVKAINEKRLNFFSSFFGISVVLDRKSNHFFQPENIEEFKNYCIQSLDDNADFLIIDYVNWVAINTGYDFTDICYLIKDSNIGEIEAIAKNNELYTFRDAG